jgi:hypothetical protein
MKLAIGVLLAGLVFAMSGCLGCTCYSYDPVNSTVYPGLPSTTVPTTSSPTTAPPAPPPPTAPPTTAASIAISLPTTSSTDLETTTTTTTIATTTTTEALSSAETRLANGHIKAMGFVDKVWEQGGKRYISIDYADFLTGDAAVQAAVADGVIAPGETIPNDYYIRNINPQKREFQVAPTALITTNSWEYMDRSITWGQFMSFWSASPPDRAGRLRYHPWWLEREGPVVMLLEEPYLP